jgi:hypothetical protein
MKRFPLYRLAFSLLGTVGLVHCQQQSEHEALLRQAMPPIDTVAVTSYSIERENHAALADWRGIQDGNELLAFPPDWRDTVQGHTIIITPGQHQGDEVLTFARFDREGASRQESEHLAQEAAQSTFPQFAVQSDSLKELVFQRGFAYERTADLSKAGTHYRGYCLI